MPRVLMLARHFPPLGGAGVHRTIGSVRHLPAHGFTPVVVTGPAQHEDRWSVHDPAMLERIPPECEVHRLDASEPGPATGLAAHAGRLMDLAPPWVRWWVEHSFRKGVEVGGDVDLVVASCLPYETAFAGARVAAALGVPWVADLEDPWALDEMRLYPSAVHRARDLQRMRQALRTASAIIMAAPEAAARVRARLPELADRIVTGIPIGFEPGDFDEPAGARDASAFRIVHTGSMHTDFGLHLRRSRRRRRLLGGAVPGLDILPRSHYFLVEAIDALAQAPDPLSKRVELHLAGGLTRGDRAIADRHAFVRAHGFLSHSQTVRLMRGADLLFLPMHDLPAGMPAGLIPYKTYEYLAARRPILAAVPDGDVRDLLAPIEGVSIVRPTDVRGMAAAIRSGVEASIADDRDLTPVAGLERSRSVERIAGVLHAVLQGTQAPAPLAA